MMTMRTLTLLLLLLLQHSQVQAAVTSLKECNLSIEIEDYRVSLHEPNWVTYDPTIHEFKWGVVYWTTSDPWDGGWIDIHQPVLFLVVKSPNALEKSQSYQVNHVASCPISHRPLLQLGMTEQQVTVNYNIWEVWSVAQPSFDTYLRTFYDLSNEEVEHLIQDYCIDSPELEA